MSASQSPIEQSTASRTTTRACPGTRVDSALVAACPAPAGVRPGRACDAAIACPSPDLLFGECRCDGGTWACDTAAPKGYDPFPDCPDDGVEAGGACYEESSMCLPASASACFTSGVPLCHCEGHAWKC